METNFITLFLEEKRLSNNDWIRTGKYIRQLKNPPKIDANTLHFIDALTDIIPEKLKIALEAQHLLIDLRKKRIELLVRYMPNEYHWFYLELEANLFKEYFVISKWINYWLSLWDKIQGIPQTTVSNNGVSDLEIQKAKEYPIESLYKGNLRELGNRLCGLCPFHQERHASFFIFKDNNRWHCFGACGEGGDSINFIRKLENLEFVDAVKYLNYGHN